MLDVHRLNRLFLVFLALSTLLVAGCRTTPLEAAPGPAETEVISAPFEDTWQATRRALLGQNYQIYTRDKRGLFVARTPMERRLLIFPERTEFVITLTELGPDRTEVTVETNPQRYKVTLLTYPSWRRIDRPVDNTAALAILDAIRSGVASSPSGTGGS